MSSYDIRACARNSLYGNWGMAILVTLIAGILGGALVSGNVSLEIDSDLLDLLPSLKQTEFWNVVSIYLTVAASVGTVLALAQFILGGVIRLGYCRYLLNVHDRGRGELKDLFSQFHRFGDAFVLSLLEAIYIFLWTLLFIIPGIIATYKYAMAPFIQLENPYLSVNEVLAESKEMMNGRKWELFVLRLSFIGWALLSVLTLGIGNLWYNPYVNMAETVFYRSLQPHFIASEPSEAEAAEGI